MEVKLAGDIHDVVIGRPNNRTLWTLGTDMGHLEESFILSLQIAESAMLTSNPPFHLHMLEFLKGIKNITLAIASVNEESSTSDI